ncbi:hypothetical protein ACF1BP_32720 [Streptomyces sp. NPDC014735]|uniref:hypothetical protein n=1 Tax=unclassified Streptomyces TaxID=2593676 RepID=UPI0036F7FFDC
MQYASEARRRTTTERRLRQAVTNRAWIREYEREQVRARQAAGPKTRTEAAQATVPAPPAPLPR